MVKDNLLFSVIIAKAPGRKTEVLDSLKTMNYDKSKYEILIEEGPSGSENRNKAIKNAKGKIMAIIDDDAIANKNLFKNAEKLFKKYKDVAIFGGPQLTPPDDNFFARTSGYVLSSSLTASKMSSRYHGSKLNLNADENNLTSAICFVRKEVFDKIGYFNTKLFPGEDPEFFRRAKKNGFKIGYSPDLYVYHRRRNNIKAFWKQNYGFGFVRIKKDKINQDKTKISFIMPSLLLIYIVISPLLIIFISKLFLIPLILYLIYILFSSAIISIKNKDILSIFLIPVIIVTMHLSYGLGMINYLLRKN